MCSLQQRVSMRTSSSCATVSTNRMLLEFVLTLATLKLLFGKRLGKWSKRNNRMAEVANTIKAVKQEVVVSHRSRTGLAKIIRNACTHVGVCEHVRVARVGMFQLSRSGWGTASYLKKTTLITAGRGKWRDQFFFPTLSHMTIK